MTARLTPAEARALGVTDPAPARARRSTRRAAPGPQRTRCHTCDAVFTTVAAEDRHLDAAHHHRYELDLDERETPMNSYDLIRPLLLEADDRDLRQAVDAYDRAVDAWRTACRAVQPPGQRRRHAEHAYRTAATAHALDPKSPAPDWSPVAAADEIDARLAVDVAALEDAVAARMRQLDIVVAARTGVLLRLVAVKRAEHGDGPMPRPVVDLYAQLPMPALAYGPAVVRSDGTLRRWWPPHLESGTRLTEPQWEAEADYRRWTWAELVHPKRFTLIDGVLTFSNVWSPPPTSHRRHGKAAAVVVVTELEDAVGRDSLDVEPGDVVMVGTGPNGEPGIDEVWWRERVEQRRVHAAFAPTSHR